MAGLQTVLALLVLLPGMACAAAVPVVDPGNPGPDRPPLGNSLFDHLTTSQGMRRLPFPFTALVELVESKLDGETAYLGETVKKVLIPLGRSLQRNAAAPDYFESPRIVIAVDADPDPAALPTGMLLRDRLYIAYLPAADILEVISYNEAAARFEFQVVRDYREGAVPQITYARRNVCMACHRNAAPIFARPLWDETNANRAIAERLADIRPEFFGVAARRGVDIAYAIDNATDRANDIALTQALWSQGCGEGGQGKACRVQLLLSVLQYALSGNRGFEPVAALSDAMHAQRGTHWPDGLIEPVADIPNRIPLQPGVNPVSGRPDELRYLADVDNRFEPLNGAEAPAVYAPDSAALVARAVAGLREFFATAELLPVDRWLLSQPARQSMLEAACEPGITVPDAVGKIRLNCVNADISLRGLLYRDSPDSTWRGRARLAVGDYDLGSIRLSGTSQGSAMTIKASREDNPLSIRLPDGRAVADMELDGSHGTDLQATLRVSLRHDFDHLAERIRELAESNPPMFNKGPFPRASLLPRLLSPGPAGDQSPACCIQTLPVPIDTVPAPEQLAPDALLNPFVQVCAGCHRSTEPFPPNFLAGSVEQARRGIGQCAERIQYRLAMWDLPYDQRSKSPMPPGHSIERQGGDPMPWEQRLLPQLRDALRALAAQHAEPLVSDSIARHRRYADLRPCLAPT